MDDVIHQADTASDFSDFAAMVVEYVDWCRARYSGDAFVDAAFSHQSLDAEIQSGFPKYRPPDGRALIARIDEVAVGCVAYRRLTAKACEMKRLVVRPAGHGRGLGRRLCQRLIELARDDGYASMRLDTAKLLTEAIGLYHSLGFRDCSPYNDYPAEVASHVVFMDRDL